MLKLSPDGVALLFSFVVIVAGRIVDEDKQVNRSGNNGCVGRKLRKTFQTGR